LHEQTLREKFPAELKGISEARQAIATAMTGFSAAEKALEYELQQTATAVPGPPPKESESWTKD
jgi:hypothetical protein